MGQQLQIRATITNWGMTIVRRNRRFINVSDRLMMSESNVFMCGSIRGTLVKSCAVIPFKFQRKLNVLIKHDFFLGPG